MYTDKVSKLKSYIIWRVSLIMVIILPFILVSLLQNKGSPFLAKMGFITLNFFLSITIGAVAFIPKRRGIFLLISLLFCFIYYITIVLSLSGTSYFPRKDSLFIIIFFLCIFIYTYPSVISVLIVHCLGIASLILNLKSFVRYVGILPIAYILQIYVMYFFLYALPNKIIMDNVLILISSLVSLPALIYIKKVNEESICMLFLRLCLPFILFIIMLFLNLPTPIPNLSKKLQFLENGYFAAVISITVVYSTFFISKFKRIKPLSFYKLISLAFLLCALTKTIVEVMVVLR